jgi:hypothetical protein
MTEKQQKSSKTLSRRFCVAPMMDGESWQEKAL